MITHPLALPALILASIIGGTGPLAAKFALLDFSPSAVLFLRFLLASLIIAPLALTKKFPTSPSFLKHSLLLALLSATNVTLFIIGIQWTTSIAASLLYTLPTLIIALLTKFRRHHEAINFTQILGLLFGLLGTLIIFIRSFTHPQEALNSLGTPLGNLIVLIGVVAYSLYIYLSQPYSRRYSPLHLSTVNFLVTTLVALPFLSLEILRNSALPTPTPISFSAIIYSATIFSVGMYVMYQWGIKHSSSFTAASTFFISPIVSTLLAIPILGERLTPHLLLGGTAVLIGVYLANRNST